MRTVFELVAQEILPSLRALTAKKMIENGLSQKQAAEKLGLSQPAISQYKRDLRGYKSKLFQEKPELWEMVNSVAARIATGEITIHSATSEIFETCKDMVE